MDELEAALQSLLQFAAGAPPVAGPPSQVNPQPGQPGGAGTPGFLGGRDWLGTILQLVLAGGGAQYGSQQLDAIKQAYALQQQAARMGMAVSPGLLAKQAALFTPQLNKTLSATVQDAADSNTALRGLATAPGAVEAARVSALAPFAEQNVGIGAELAQNANQLAISRLAPALYSQPPDYLTTLSQLGRLGQNQTYSLPGVP